MNIYDELEYTELLDVNKKHPKFNSDEYKHLGVDKVYFSGDYPAIFFKEVKQFDKETLKNIAKIQHNCWNYRKVMFLCILSSNEIRIYNCNKKPFNYKLDDIDIPSELEKIELIHEDLNALKTIKELFSRIAVDCGTIWNTENELREKIEIQHRIDKYLVKSLLNAARSIKNMGLDDEIIHVLIMRSIFIMYLEDKGAVKETNIYDGILKGAKSYFDILENKNATYKLFSRLEEHFNGNVFPLIKNEYKNVNAKHLQIIKKCLYDGDLSGEPKFFEWRLFKFDIIQIEFLSEIYENFLEEFKSNNKEETGQFFTPPSLVELIYNERLKVKNEINWHVKILDMACGSGIFLVEGFKRLVKRWENANNGKQISFRDLKEIMIENIFGIEYDQFAIKVATFSLYLAMVEYLNPRTLWIDRRNKFPNLINDPNDKSIEKQGKNLFRADTIGEIKPESFPKVKLIVGNPPFGARIKLKSIKDFCKRHYYGHDMVIPFLRKAVEFTEDGSLALIFNTKILTNTKGPFQNFRKWLFNETYVEKIYNLSIFRKSPKTFGGQLFTSAIGPISILFYQKIFPKKQAKTIEYWAPKTYVKNNVIEGILIDTSDIKFLPRKECQKYDTNIWKIAMWGTLGDYYLIEKLNKECKSIQEYFRDEYKIYFGVGLELSNPKDKFNNKIRNLVHHNPKTIHKYYTDLNYGIKIFDKYFRRFGKTEAYKAPHVLIKEGVTNGEVISSYLDYDSSFYKGIVGAYSKTNNENGLKILNTYLNSDIVRYLSFLMTSSWGIERDTLKYNEILLLPYVLANSRKNEEKFLRLSNIIISKFKNNVFNDSHNFKQQINDIIFNVLDEDDKIYIEDTLKYTLNLFLRGYKSLAMQSTDLTFNNAYAEFFIKKLIDFLGKEVFESFKIQITFYELQSNDPLNLVKIKFGSISHKIIEEKDIKLLKQLLLEIDRKITEKKAQSIFIKKQVKYFENNSIYIIKPNQKRFWTRSMALHDAKELIGEILNTKQ